jgi:hypothetical protein
VVRVQRDLNLTGNRVQQVLFKIAIEKLKPGTNASSFNFELFVVLRT